MKNMKDFYLKHRLNIGILFFVLMLFFLFYTLNKMHNVNITVEFKDLRPFHHKIDVYYKGFKIGHAGDLRPADDYQTTLMSVTLHAKDLKLPVNMVAKLKREKSGRREVDYVDLIYPENPSFFQLESGDKIPGTVTIDFDTFLASQDPDSLITIRDNLVKTSEQLDETLIALTDLLNAMSGIINDNRPNVLSATRDIKIMTSNMRQVSEKINNSVSQKNLTNTMTNLDTSTEGMKEIVDSTTKLTNQLGNMTQKVDRMLPKVDSILGETYSLVKNAADISCNISKTMDKPFGGMRILFGKSGDNPSCKRCKK